MFSLKKKRQLVNQTKTDSLHHINLVIIRTSSIGDLVLSTACLNLIEQIESRYPIKFQICWIGAAPSIDFIRAYYPRVHAIDIKKDGFLKTLKRSLSYGKADIVLNLQNNIRAWSFSYMLSLFSFTKVHAYDKRSKARNSYISQALNRGRSQDLLTSDIDTRFKLFRSMSSSLLDAIKEIINKDKLNIDLNIDLNFVHPSLDTSSLVSNEDSIKVISDIDPSRYNLVISRGGSFSPKKAPLSLLNDIFSKLSNLLDGRISSKIDLIFIGSRSDTTLNQELINQLCSTYKIKNYTAKLSLVQTSLLLSRCNILLGNDSLHFHLMEAVGGKSLGLWGPTFENFGFSCWNPQSRIFSSLLGCRPCSKHGQTPCRFEDYRCFSLIDSSKVASYLAEDINSFFNKN